MEGLKARKTIAQGKALGNVSQKPPKPWRGDRRQLVLWSWRKSGCRILNSC